VTPRDVPSRAWILDAVLPPRCVACGASAAGLCVSCRWSLRPVRPPLCRRCGAPTAWPVERCRECAGRRLAFTTARSAFVYVGPAPHLLRAWKERGLRRLAPLAAELVAERLPPPAADIITYIAPDPIRQLTRSCHPAESLATELSRLWGLPGEALIRRARSSARQASLPRERRQANARGSFTARGCRSAAGRAGRRRLHDRSHRERSRRGAEGSGCRSGRGSDVRPGCPLKWPKRERPKRSFLQAARTR
jgi:predicted amidophosphoribosyltransferase